MIVRWVDIDNRAHYLAAPRHPSIVVAAPCAGQQGTCTQQPANVYLQTLMYKDVGRHKARPLQLLIIGKRTITWNKVSNSYISFVLSTCWEIRNDYADSHPEITSIRSLHEAHSSVTPGQDAKRTQTGELCEQGKSASKRLTSIFDAQTLMCNVDVC